MPTGNFQGDLTSASGNAIVECVNARNILQKELAESKNDYHAIIGEFVLDSCDIATNIISLTSAPIPDIDILEDTKSQQAAKIHNIWSNYPKAGVQLYLDTGNGIWKKQGQPIVVQNKPFQLPTTILKPYLSSSNNFKFLDRKGRLGAQVLLSTGWAQLGIGDEISIKGDWRFTVELKEKINKSIDNIVPVTISLEENVPKLIRGNNTNRRLLVLTNDGNNKAYVHFGSISEVSDLTGIPLLSGDSITYEISRTNITTPVSAICPVGQTRIIGFEGWSNP